MDTKRELAAMHMQARYDAGKTQEYVALEMGVTKKTIANWEKGISTPDLCDSIRFFKVLGLNPMPYFLRFLLPGKVKNLNTAEECEKIEAIFDQMCMNLSIENKRALLYLFYGNHGSSPNAIIQMLLAHLHTPIKDRVLQAGIIARTYEMEKELGSLICTEYILPDMDLLNSAIESGKISALNREQGYTI